MHFLYPLTFIAALTLSHSAHASTERTRKTYDYIIIGGGTSGLVLANRLSSNPKHSVLIIERGPLLPQNDPKSTIPYYGRFLNTEYMLNPTSAPIPGLNNQTSSIPVASVVGGGSVVNGMAYMRGAPSDYDAWESLGNPGWGWKDLVPYFKRSSEFLESGREAVRKWGITWDLKWYGRGQVKVTVPEFQYEDLKVVRDAWVRDRGVVERRDMGAGGVPGLYWVPESIDKREGVRSSARRAYYDPVRGRKNLELLTGYTVQEILFQGLRAKGVRMVSTDGRSSEVYAKKEIILAAGAIQTPQVLQVSGIGPKEVLKAAGIKVKKDLPGVGANLQDHATIVTTYALERQSFPNYDSLTTNATYNATAWEEYNLHRTGPVAAGTGSTALLFSLPQLTPESTSISHTLLAQSPEAYLPPMYTASPTLLSGYLAQRKVLASNYPSNTSAISSGSILGTGFAASLFLKPTSRGTVTLNPSDPHSLPIVQYNTLSNPIDLRILLSILRNTRSFWLSSPSLQSAFGKITEATPGAQFQKDAELETALRNGFLLPGLAHAAGTCAMIPESLGGCVDTELRVYGIKGLRVVDASIMPLIVGGGLQATVYAVAEKAADLILGRRGR